MFSGCKLSILSLWTHSQKRLQGISSNLAQLFSLSNSRMKRLESGGQSSQWHHNVQNHFSGHCSAPSLRNRRGDWWEYSPVPTLKPCWFQRSYERPGLRIFEGVASLQQRPYLKRCLLSRVLSIGAWLCWPLIWTQIWLFFCSLNELTPEDMQQGNKMWEISGRTVSVSSFSDVSSAEAQTHQFCWYWALASVLCKYSF